MPAGLMPSSCSIRWRISAAALLVKVTDRIECGEAFDLDQPGDTVHQHAGFTGTGTGQDQLTPDRGRYGLALGIVEGVQQEGEVIIAHPAILGPGRGRANAADANRQAGDLPFIGMARQPAWLSGRIWTGGTISKS
jgi:hypothetical protein